MKCNRRFSSLVVTIEGETFSIPAKQLIGDEIAGKPGVCALHMVSHKYPNQDWILGLPFAREFCQFHDVGARKIGFGKHAR